MLVTNMLSVAAYAKKKIIIVNLGLSVFESDASVVFWFHLVLYQVQSSTVFVGWLVTNLRRMAIKPEFVTVCIITIYKP